MKKIMYYSSGFFAGLTNGLLGAGGSILTVSILKKMGLDSRKAHSTSICIILPICFMSAFIYIKNGVVSLDQAYPYIPGGILGAIFGAFVLSKINKVLLRKIFGIFIIWAASQLIFR